MSRIRSRHDETPTGFLGQRQDRLRRKPESAEVAQQRVEQLRIVSSNRQATDLRSFALRRSYHPPAGLTPGRAFNEAASIPRLLLAHLDRVEGPLRDVAVEAEALLDRPVRPGKSRQRAGRKREPALTD